MNFLSPPGTGSQRRLLLIAGAGLIAIYLALALASFVSHSGSWVVLAAFHCCFFLLMAMALPQPRSYFYFFFSAFLFLGFWPKVVMQLIWAPGFIDPVGDFSGTAAEWDAAFAAAIAGAAGLIIVRLGQLILARRKAAPASHSAPRLPDWYERFRGWIWTATLVSMILLNLLNFHYAFFQIGVNPKVVLPYKLNVPAAWLINVGFALWIAAMLRWEQMTRAPRLATALLAPVLEAMTSSIGTLSRLTYPLHTLPHALAVFDQRGALRKFLSLRKILLLGLTLLLCFVFSIYAVFWLRVNIYYYIPSEDSIPHEVSVRKQVHRTIAYQLPHLFVQRWIGLEGVLVASTAKERNTDLLVQVMTTDPKLGAKSLFQQLAKVHYFSEDPDRFTFLANAGIVALLLFSGSLAVVTAGMALIMSLLLVMEAWIARLLANDYFASIAGAFAANILVQTTFPYLTLIFFLQLCVAILFVAGLQRIQLGTPKNN